MVNFKLSKKVIIISTSILATLVAILFLLFLPFRNIEERIKNEYNSNPIFSTTGEPLLNGFNSALIGSDKHHIDVVSYNPLKPIAVLVVNIPSNGNDKVYQYIDYIYLERSGVDTFKVVDTTSGVVKNKSYEETLKLAKKQDIFKNNPDKENITNYDKIETQQIQKSSSSSAKDIGSPPNSDINSKEFKEWLEKQYEGR